MSEKLNLFFVLICFVTLTQFGYCQVCTRRTTEVITKIISYTHSYNETYRTRCGLANCVKTRERFTSSSKSVPLRKTKIVEECCTGYIREDTENDKLSCKPICVPACKNGLCRRPGECVCLDGYSPGATNSHKCFPICEVECTHGTCVAPNTCACDSGYSLQNGTCQPICTEPCENGRCSAPDTCECLPGYRKVDNNCEPYCSKGCTNGICIGPEECQCDYGYKEEDNQCVPTCEPECGNGTCVGPDICLCDPGYEYQSNTCELICNTSCGSGSCIGPDTCDCDPGFELENGTCRAACTDCTNDDSKKCVKTICLNPDNISGGGPEYPTTYDSDNIDNEESIDDADDNAVTAIYYNQTTQIYGAVTEDGTNENNNDTMINNNMDNTVTSAKQDAEDNWFLSIGIYVIASVVVLLFVTLIIAWLVFKKFLPRSSYVVDEGYHVGCTSSRSIDLEQSV